ncbi:hypothetical protein RRG08_032038 [Elysia crispata]|uniref:Uncharacterized protein n=1 Tax=Elysia crispata TaxID=231223 RepID=A0AAE0XWI6_9GAST|nr:hypothetical protein RRG08_032038 [Elysia crispata]
MIFIVQALCFLFFEKKRNGCVKDQDGRAFRLRLLSLTEATIHGYLRATLSLSRLFSGGTSSRAKNLLSNARMPSFWSLQLAASGHEYIMDHC